MLVGVDWYEGPMTLAADGYAVGARGRIEVDEWHSGLLAWSGEAELDPSEWSRAIGLMARPATIRLDGYKSSPEGRCCLVEVVDQPRGDVRRTAETLTARFQGSAEPPGWLLDLVL